MSNPVEDIESIFDNTPETIKKVFPGAKEITLTTDEMDQITADERNKVVGFCEHCEEWWHFTKGTDPDTHTCGTSYSSRHGFQLTSQRSFNEELAKKKKFPKKK